MNIKSISSKLKGNPTMVEGTVYSMLIICSISAFFGWLADKTSIEFIFRASAFLPLLGIIAGFLPNTQKVK